MTHTDHDKAELNALTDLGVCTRAHAQRAVGHLIAHADDYANMSVSDRVDLALAVTAHAQYYALAAAIELTDDIAF